MKDVFKYHGHLISHELMKVFDYEMEGGCSKEKRLENAKILLFQYDESKYPGKSKHDEYIHSKKWKTRRKSFIKANLHYGGVDCYICRMESIDNDDKFAWNLHHNSYDNFGHKQFFIEMEDLITLCPDCHESLHSVIDELLQGTNRKIFSEYRQTNGKFLDPDGCFKFGKYRGEHVSEVPQSYLSWVRNETNSEYDIDLIDHYEEY
jgi:hypothetical protein